MAHQIKRRLVGSAVILFGAASGIGIKLILPRKAPSLPFFADCKIEARHVVLLHLKSPSDPPEVDAMWLEGKDEIGFSYQTPDMPAANFVTLWTTEYSWPGSPALLQARAREADPHAKASTNPSATRGFIRCDSPGGSVITIDWRSNKGTNTCTLIVNSVSVTQISDRVQALLHDGYNWRAREKPMPPMGM